MSARMMLTGLLVAGVLCLPVAGRADTQTTHRVHKAVKKPAPLPPPLPSGTQGPVPQIPLDAIPAVAPQVSYEDGMLTIVAPNSTLGDILRGVRKHTSADIEIPPTASERVVTRLGPGPAREVVAELLNGSRFNYILLGSPQDANLLVRVVLVAKTPDTPASTPAVAGNTPAPPADVAAADAPEAEATDDTADDTADATPEPEQPVPVPPDQQGVRTPQQMLQEMQQRQLQMQQQQQGGQPVQPGQPGIYPPPPGLPIPQRPPQQQPQQDQQQ
jgi:hypothetical protein